jgi:curved DNA-binding protein CbpA
MNLYEELELTKECSSEEIKQQYRSLANRYHPDKQGGDADKFKRIKLAYEVLSDPKRREEYNRTGNTKPPTNHRSDAYEQLSVIFDNIVTHFDVDNEPLINIMKNEVVNILVNAQNNQAACEKSLQRLNVVRNKLRKKNKDDDDMLMFFLKQKIEIRQQELQEYPDRIAACGAMLEILEDYEYGYVELPSSILG